MLLPNPMRTGIDMVDHSWIKEQLDTNKTFAYDIFTQSEMDEYNGLTPERQLEYIAGRYAAKQAVIKCLVGFDHIRYDDVEILTGPKGQPYMSYFDEVNKTLDKIGLGSIEVSISHTAERTIAIAVAGRSSR